MYYTYYMAELKTKLNDISVEEFLRSVLPEQRREDGLVLLQLFTEATGETAKMWGSSIVGFGMYHYKSERSSQEGDWPLVAFSPRKTSLSLYLTSGEGLNTTLLNKLGKHKLGKGCLYINKLADVDPTVLLDLIKDAYSTGKKFHS